MRLILALVAGAVGCSPALALSIDQIQGRWQYDGFFFENHRYPNPNPELVLTFTFTNDGKSVLSWRRENENSFCEREASYHLVGEHLWQKVTWVNPKNSPDCASDSDMRLGAETDTVISLAEPELSFHFDLNGKAFLYILKRVAPPDASAAND
jgi:hypothetical protein